MVPVSVPPLAHARGSATIGFCLPEPRPLGSGWLSHQPTACSLPAPLCRWSIGRFHPAKAADLNSEIRATNFRSCRPLAKKAAEPRSRCSQRPQVSAKRPPSHALRDLRNNRFPSAGAAVGSGQAKAADLKSGIRATNFRSCRPLAKKAAEPRSRCSQRPQVSAKRPPSHALRDLCTVRGAPEPFLTLIGQVLRPANF